MDKDFQWIKDVDPLDALDKTKDYKVWFGHVTAEQREIISKKIREKELCSPIYFRDFDNRTINSIYFSFKYDEEIEPPHWNSGWMGYRNPKISRFCEKEGIVKYYEKYTKTTKEQLQKDLEFFKDDNSIELPPEYFT